MLLNKEEKDWLRENHTYYTQEQIAEKYNTNIQAVKECFKRMGLKKVKFCPGDWEMWEIELLLGNLTNNEIAKLTGRKEYLVKYKRWGVKKNILKTKKLQE